MSLLHQIYPVDRQVHDEMSHEYSFLPVDYQLNPIISYEKRHFSLRSLMIN